MNYNTNQHAISSYTVLSDVNDPTSDQTSESQHQLTRLVYNPYEKLEQSLISGNKKYIWLIETLYLNR